MIFVFYNSNLERDQDYICQIDNHDIDLFKQYCIKFIDLLIDDKKELFDLDDPLDLNSYQNEIKILKDQIEEIKKFDFKIEMSVTEIYNYYLNIIGFDTIEINGYDYLDIIIYLDQKNYWHILNAIYVEIKPQ